MPVSHLESMVIGAVLARRDGAFGRHLPVALALIAGYILVMWMGGEPPRVNPPSP
jgi:hypothetical protein